MQMSYEAVIDTLAEQFTKASQGMPTITYDQLAKMLRDVPFNVPADQAGQMAAAADAKQDGFIDLEEFLPLALQLMGDSTRVGKKPVAGAFDESTEMIIELLRGAYEAGDVNEDGVLQPLEFVGLLAQPPFGLSYA